MKKEFDKEIKQALTLAEDRIDTAQALLKLGKFRDVVSKSYYAILEAARAALLTKGIAPKSHHGTFTLFSFHFVKTNIVPIKIARWFAKAMEAREEADYERFKKFSKETAQESIKAAKEFIEIIKDLIEEE